MKFLKDYSYDVFVSYAHGPEAQASFSGEHPNLLSDWTHRFVDHLRAQIDHNLSQTDFEGDDKPRARFFLDPKLEASGSLTENLRSKARDSALFVSVMSPSYLRSKWCTEEIEWFLSGSPTENPELRRFPRIFVARIIPTDYKSWPSGLKDEAGDTTLGYIFHPPADAQTSVTPFGWPVPSKKSEKDYWDAIERLAGEMTAKLLRLKKLERVRTDKSETAVVEPAVGRQVYLGLTHDTLDTVRDELRRELTKLGLQVLPPENDEASDEATLRESLDTYLDRAHVMALCANQFCGKWPRDQNGGFISLQVQKAKERNKQCQLWLSWDGKTELQTPQYKEFLQALIDQSKNPPNVRIQHESVQDFAQYVKSTINEEKIVHTGVEQAAVVCSNLNSDEDVYRRFHETVTTAIGETDRGALLLRFDKTSKHILLKDMEKQINRADTIVVICFDQDLDWASNVMREIHHLIKAGSAKRASLLLIGPQAKQGISFDGSAFRFRTVDAHTMEEARLRELLKEAILGSRQDGTKQPPKMN